MGVRSQIDQLISTNAQILSELQLTRATLSNLFLNVMTELQGIATELQTIRGINQNSLNQIIGVLENTGIAAEELQSRLPGIAVNLNNLLFAQRACCLNFTPPSLPLLPPDLPPVIPVTSELCRRMRAVAYQLRDLFAQLARSAATAGALSAGFVATLIGTVLAPETSGLSLLAASSIASAITTALGNFVTDQIIPSDAQLEYALNAAFPVRSDGWEAANEAFAPAIEQVMDGLPGRAFRIFFIALSGFRRAFDSSADLGDISEYSADCGEVSGWIGHVDYVDYGSPTLERIYRWGAPITMTQVNPFGQSVGPARYFSPGGGVPGGSVFWNASSVTVGIALWSGTTLILNTSVAPGATIALDVSYTLGYIAGNTSEAAEPGTLRFQLAGT